MNQVNAGDVNFYLLTFMSKTTGMVASKHSLEDTKDKITSDMAEQLGDDGYNILEFKQVSSEEVINLGYDIDVLIDSVKEFETESELTDQNEIAPGEKPTLH